MIPRFFTNLECDNALAWPLLVDTLEDAMMRFSTGGIQQPVRESLAVEKYQGFLGMMPCYSESDNVLACKLVSLYPNNWQEHGLSTHIVYVLLFDASNGSLLALLEGESITKRRTAATSAVSARWLLSSRQPKTLAVLGAGHQALAHVQVLTNQHNLSHVKVWNYRKTSAENLAETVSGWLSGIQVSVCDTVAECVSDADLVVTATFSSTPILSGAWLKPGAHVMAVGAARPNMAEMEPQLLNSAQVYVDSYAGARAESGDIIHSGCAIKSELGQVIATGKKADDQDTTTVFKSLGLAVQDLVAAKMVYDQYRNEKQQKVVPVPIWTTEKVKLWQQEEKNNDLEGQDDVTAVLMAQTSVESQKVTLKCEAKLLNNKAIVVNLKTTAECNLCMVYKAKTGQLMGITDGRAMTEMHLVQQEKLSSQILLKSNL